MITIKNSQRRITIDTKLLHHQAQTILDALHYSDFDLGILLTSEPAIQKLNREHRQQDKPTDILSFAYHPNAKPGKRIQAKTAEDKNLGDLILCPSYIQKDLPRWNQSFDERMKVLLVHGICHLLGYDHIEDEDYKVMQRLEKKLLKKI